MFAKFGVKLCLRPAQGSRDTGGKPAKPGRKLHPWLGATLVNRNGCGIFRVVHAGSPAELAGLSAGDEAVAIDGLKVTASNLDSRLKGYHNGDSAQVTVFRGDELLNCTVRLEEPPADTCYLELIADTDKSSEQRRAAWLSGD